MALTKRDLDRLRYDPAGAKVQIHYDGNDRESVPGFGVRVYPSDRLAFVVWYRTEGGRKRLQTLGRYGVLTIGQARELARKTLVEAQGGADPLEERRQHRSGDTVRDLAALYLRRHAKPRKKSWKEDERRIDRYILPALGSRRLAELRRADVARFHTAIGSTAPVEANRVLALLRSMLNLARDWGLLEEDAPNPATRIRKFPERSRERWVTPAEMPRLMEAIDAEESPYVRAALRLYLLTGLRRSELLGLRWKDIDFDRKEIRLPDTKAGRPHTLPLSGPALEILHTLPRQLGNAYVFPGDKPGQPLVNISKPWLRIRARFWAAGNPEEAARLRRQAETEIARGKKHAGKGPEAVEARFLKLAREALKGEEDVRLHDLRRTVGSWLATNGASLPLIGKVLNHSNASTTQIYARLQEDAARTALEQHADRIAPFLHLHPAAHASDAEAAPVTPIARKRS